MIVCGGGSSLLEDLNQCPDIPKIACNHHAYEIGLHCEYTIYSHKDFVEEKLKDYTGEKIWVRPLKEFRWFGYIGTAAVIYAIRKLEAEKVYIAGIDLYTGTQKYCHPHEGKEGNEKRGLANQKAWWNQCFKYLGEDVNKIQSISGPLVDLCKQWSVVARSA